MLPNWPNLSLLTLLHDRVVVTIGFCKCKTEENRNQVFKLTNLVSICYLYTCTFDWTESFPNWKETFDQVNTSQSLTSGTSSRVTLKYNLRKKKQVRTIYFHLGGRSVCDSCCIDLIETSQHKVLCFCQLWYVDRPAITHMVFVLLDILPKAKAKNVKHYSSPGSFSDRPY